VEAAKSKCKSLQCVKIHLQSIFVSKDGAWKTECFCIILCYFSKTKCKSTKPIMQRYFSCQNKSVCQKIAFDPAKIKIDPKCYIRPFCMKPSIRRENLIPHLPKESFVNSNFCLELFILLRKPGQIQ